MRHNARLAASHHLGVRSCAVQLDGAVIEANTLIDKLVDPWGRGTLAAARKVTSRDVVASYVYKVRSRHLPFAYCSQRRLLRTRPLGSVTFPAGMMRSPNRLIQFIRVSPCTLWTRNVSKQAPFRPSLRMSGAENAFRCRVAKTDYRNRCELIHSTYLGVRTCAAHSPGLSDCARMRHACFDSGLPPGGIRQTANRRPRPRARPAPAHRESWLTVVNHRQIPSKSRK